MPLGTARASRAAKEFVVEDSMQATKMIAGEEKAKVKVLDFGYIRVIETWGSDERIIEAARMSTGKGFQGWGTPEKPGDEKLLRYLWTHRHTSPFEQAGASFEAQAPIMVFREWMRHRTQSFNEFSARYAEMPDLHYLPDPSRIKGHSKKNRQATGDDDLPGEIVAEFRQRIEREQQMMYETYSWALGHGVAREIARINTPVSRYSKMRASANLLNWLRFLGPRMAESAQWEIRQYAEAIASEIERYFPRTWKLFEEKPL
jgi:thymidylate synthase (FAD)